MSQPVPPTPTEAGEKENANLTQKSIGGIAWTSLGALTQGVAQLAVIAVLGRLLNKQDFGLANIVTILMGFVNLFGQLGFGPALVQIPNLTKQHLRTAATLSVGLSSILTVGVFTTASIIAGFFHAPMATDLIRVSAIAFVVQGVSIVAESQLQREFNFKRLAMAEVISFVVGYGGVGITLALMRMGAWALVLGTLAQILIRSAILIASKRSSIRLGYDASLAKGLISFGAGHTLASIANFVATTGDNMVVGRVLGPTELGLYGRAYQFANIPVTLFGRIANKVIYSGMSRLNEELERLANAYARSLALVSIIAVPSSVAMIALGPEIIAILLGPGWEAAVLPFQFLLASLLPRMTYKVSISLITSSGQPLKRAIPSALYAVAVLIGASVGAKFGGINGVAVAIAIAIFLNDFLLMAQSKAICHIGFRSLVAAYLSGVPLGVVTAVVVWPLAVALRAAHMPAILTLILAMGVGMGVSGIAASLTKGRLLGSHGRWAADQGQKAFAKISRKLLRRPAPTP